ncbi:nlaIVM, partial [Symbiodinium necroappetens]
RAPVEQQLLDPIQKHYVSGWGRTMLARTGMRNAVRRFLDYDLPVMSDCSGAEGGLLALKALDIQVDHVSSCESNHKAVEFIAKSFHPKVFYPDVCDRELDERNYGCVALVAGFPCQFSRLRRESQLLEEEDAKPFFAIIETLKSLKLPLYILENVLGIRKCMHIIKPLLRRQLPGYYHAVLQLNAKDLGDVVSRPRVYFIGILRKYAGPTIGSHDDLQAQISYILRKAQSESTFRWRDLVLEDASGEAEGGMPSKRRPTDPCPKWCHIHWKFMKDHKVNPKKLKHSVKGRQAFGDQRRRHAVDVMATLHGEEKPRILNVSQQLDRMHIRKNCIGCLTPGSSMYMLHLGRSLSGLEMMLFQGFDISQLNLHGMDDKAMHIRSAGVAWLAAFSAMDLSRCGSDGLGFVSRFMTGDVVMMDVASGVDVGMMDFAMWDSVIPGDMVMICDGFGFVSRFRGFGSDGCGFKCCFMTRDVDLEVAWRADVGYATSGSGWLRWISTVAMVFHGDEDSDSEEDAYQRNGKSKKRIANAMKKRCCAQKCKKQLVFKMVRFLVSSFWSLTKGGQDALLWSMQNPLWVPEEGSDEDEESHSSSIAKKTVAVSWHLEGAAG